MTKNTTYQPPFLLQNRHFATIYPTLFRKIGRPPYVRKRYETTDQDFFDVDFLTPEVHKSIGKKLVLILHGLEGSSESKYAKGLAMYLTQQGMHVGVMNHRGCSGEPNRLLSSYHSGFTDDIDHLVQQTASDYDELYLVGFSLGGNVVLKYAGENGSDLPGKIKKAVGISVPCNLKGAAIELKKRSNFIYMKRFLKTLKAKALEKLDRFPDAVIRPKAIEQCRSFFDFDEYFTAPVHGFNSAEDYWAKCSSKPFIPKIAIPTLIINAKNDPFLSPSCFPVKEAQENPNVSLEMPDGGGHVGFRGKGGSYWIEERVFRFLGQ